MTHHYRFVAPAALLAMFGTACAADATPPAATKVFDFSSARLDDLHRIPAPKPGPLSKGHIRYAIQAVQPALLACYTTHGRGAGTIELQLRLVGELDGTLVDSVDVGGDAALGNTALADCMRKTAMTIELPAMHEAGVWQVLYPFTVK